MKPQLPLSQKKLHIKIDHSLLKDAVIMRIEGEEAVSELFCFDVFLQTNKDIDIEMLLNTEATISLNLEFEKTTFFSGIIEKASFENIPSILSTRTDNIIYLKIVPTLSRTKYTKKYRTFQEKTAEEIIEFVLKENDIRDLNINLQSSGKSKRTFCVQYGESDFHFISRLMEEEGIFYNFEHSNAKNTLIISDNSISAKTCKTDLKIRKKATNATLTTDSIFNVSFSSQIGICKTTSYSFNVLKASVVNAESFDFKERYKIGYEEICDKVFAEKTSGEKISKIALESANSRLKTLLGQSYCPEISSGRITNIAGSFSKKHNGNFFMISIKHVINQISTDSSVPAYHNSFVAIPSNVPFRPANKHKKNRIIGCQTAVVTGTSGEEIYCNESGCIKVKFPWDSRTKLDEKSSCWVRVSQNWAGNNFGSIITPRIGMEVVVDFINGDPDQPIVSKCLFNGVNKPPANYTKNQKTVSTFYTKSYKEKGFNELRFDDQTNKEEIYFHAQKDLNYSVENSLTEIINEGSRATTLESKKNAVENSITIKKGVNKLTINEGDYIIILDKGNQSITLKEGNQRITLSKGDIFIDVTGNINIKSTKNIKLEADGTIDFFAKNAFAITSNDNITVKASKNFSLSSLNNSQKATQKYSISCLNYELNSNANLKITSLNVNISANVALNIKSSAAANIQATAMMNVSSSAILALKGAMLKLN